MKVAKITSAAEKELKQNVVKPNRTNAGIASFARTTPKGISLHKIKTQNDNDAETSIAGEYYVFIGDYYYMGGAGSITEFATIEENEGTITISSDYFATDVEAEYDAETGVITFNTMNFGEIEAGDGETYDYFMEPFYWDYDEESVIPTSWTAQFDATEGVITTKPDHGLSWKIAYEDEDGNPDFSYIDIFDLEGFQKYNGEAIPISGEYIVSIGDWYFQDGIGSYTDYATIEENEGTITISCPSFVTDVVAEYDAETGTITFNATDFGAVSGGYYMRFTPFYWEDEIIDESWSATYDSRFGTITTDPDHGLSWEAYGDEDYAVFLGYFNIFDLEGLVKDSSADVDPDEGWTYIGDATFMDGWVLPLFDVDQTNPENWYKVPVQQNDANSNVFRLVDPYKYGYAADYNQCTKTGYIQFDVTDPDHVVFAAVQSGFAFPAAGVTEFYCMNQLGSIAGYYDIDPAELVDILGDVIPYTTFKNGVVTLSVEEIDGKIEYDACFGYQGNPYAGTYWRDENNTQLYMVTKIDLSAIDGLTGVSEIVNNAQTAPARFFNLQGIEIAHPAAGQVVIKKEGNNVTKQIAR